MFLKFSVIFYGSEYLGVFEEGLVMVSTDSVNWSTVHSIEGIESDWRKYFVNLSDYAGEPKVYLAIKYSDGGGFGPGMALDNLEVYAPEEGLDIATNWITLGKMDARPEWIDMPVSFTGYPLQIKARIQNMLTEPVTSFQAVWTDGTNNYIDDVTGLNLEGLDVFEYVHTVPYSAQFGEKEVMFYLAEINGGEYEADIVNNIQLYTVEGIEPHPDKKVLSEEGTGTWCSWCPRGTVFMDYMSAEYPDQFIGIAVHNGDPMKVTTYDNGLSAVINYTYPRVALDREDILDPQDMEKTFLERVQQVPPVILSGDAHIIGDTLKIDITAEFTQSLSGNYRFNAAVVEDEVTGTTSDYNQSNAYAGNDEGPMGGYEFLPSPVPAADMVYDHVARAILGGFNGTQGSLPATIDSGSVHNWSYNYIIPSDVDKEKLKVVSMIVVPNNEVVNANTMEIGFPTSIHSDQLYGIKLYPNPADQKAFIELNPATTSDVSLSIMNNLGEVVGFKNYGMLNGSMVLPINTGMLSSGIYFLTLEVGSETLVRKLVVSR